MRLCCDLGTVEFRASRPYDPTRCGNPLPRAGAARARFPSIVSGPSRLCPSPRPSRGRAHSFAPAGRYSGGPPRSAPAFGPLGEQPSMHPVAFRHDASLSIRP